MVCTFELCQLLFSQEREREEGRALKMQSEPPRKRHKAFSDGALRGGANGAASPTANDSPSSSSTRNGGLLTSLLLVHCELGDELLGFLDPRTTVTLCTVLCFNKKLKSMLEDHDRWRILLELHCGIHEVKSIFAVDASSSALHNQVHEREEEGNSKLEIMVKRTIPVFGCRALTEYVSLRSQLLHLQQNVLVVKGDLGAIKSVDNQPIDCLVFPTSGCFRNPGVGVAGRVHERAGPQLDASIKRQRIERSFMQCGQVLCTSGFKAGVSLLVHCVGPPGNIPGSNALLYQTYRNALLSIDDNTAVTCAAIASISTGRLQFPVESAAKIALRAVRDLVLEWDFDAKLVFVCLEKPVLAAFERARREMLQAVQEASFVTMKVEGAGVEELEL